MNTSLSTPVLLIIFNRTKTLMKVFDAIRAVKPSRLYIAADGPRADRPDDVIKCAEARRVATAVDWECEVKMLFRDTNRGCGRSIADAITWMFETETEGIILEDDCVPTSDFFSFCTELLERYRHDKRIMGIGGNNFIEPHLRDDDYSYYFSCHNYIWGWATWKRAWKLFDYDTSLYREICEKRYIEDCFNSIYEKEYYNWVFNRTFGSGQTGIWDYQWELALIIHSGLTIVPNRNLVVNMGFDDEATHTTGVSAIPGWRHESMLFPLRHPEFVLVDKKRDMRFFNKIFTTRSSRLRSNVKRIIPEAVVKKWIRPLWRAVRRTT